MQNRVEDQNATPISCFSIVSYFVGCKFCQTIVSSEVHQSDYGNIIEVHIFSKF